MISPHAPDGVYEKVAEALGYLSVTQLHAEQRLIADVAYEFGWSGTPTERDFKRWERMGTNPDPVEEPLEAERPAHDSSTCPVCRVRGEKS